MTKTEEDLVYYRRRCAELEKQVEKLQAQVREMPASIERSIRRRDEAERKGWDVG
jgi:cell division protein FtsB